MKKKTQPSKTKAEFVVFDIRMTREELQKVTAAAQSRAKLLRVPYSRNAFCVAAVLELADRTLKEPTKGAR